MTNTKELEADIARSGLSKKYICSVLNISPMAFFNKINNITEFKASEIKTLQALLGQTDRRRDFVFFAPDSD